MLEEWILQDFKSFESKKTLNLKGLTLICGANSSGKSTVIQSILLIKQTLLHAPASRPISLNGALVRLGVFSDIHNFNAKKRDAAQSIGIGWKIKKNVSRQLEGENLNFKDDELVSVSVFFRFEAKGDGKDQANLELAPILQSTSITAKFRSTEGEDHYSHVSLDKSTGAGRKLTYNESSYRLDSNFKEFRISEIDPDTSARAIEGLPAPKIVGCNVSHFMPSDIVVRYDRGRLNARQLASRLTGLRGPTRRLQSITVPVPDRVKAIIAQAMVADTTTMHRFKSDLDNVLPEKEWNNVNVGELIARIHTLPPIIRRTVFDRLSKYLKPIESSIYQEVGEDLVLTSAIVDILRDATSTNSEFFRFAVRYLGPLRDEPRPSYPLQALSSPTDVGPKGELTAAVLHLNERRKVTYIPSKGFLIDRIEPETKITELRSAVVDWLNYLGVASDIETNEKGKFGHELRVKSSSSDSFQDLTNVGVGVSQVLPIIVTCLLAPPGAAIILEQPELHLHPKVQARLADFFISMMLLDKQCIIETHGEHLIERIRLRIVSDPSNVILDDTQIYFFTNKKGSTECQEVKLNQFGAVLDWPEDFFDQSQKESQRIVTKALERRKLASRSGDKS